MFDSFWRGWWIAFTLQTILLASIALFSCESKAADPWTDKQVNLGIAWGVLQAIDYSQTRYIAKHPDKFYEKESARYMGEHPSVSRVTNHFIVTTTVNLAIMHYLPSNYRTPFQYIMIGYTGGAVLHNYRIGIKLDF